MLGTHAGAASRKHLQAYLDEFALPPQPPQDQGLSRIVAHVIDAKKLLKQIKAHFYAKLYEPDADELAKRATPV